MYISLSHNYIFTHLFFCFLFNFQRILKEVQEECNADDTSSEEELEDAGEYKEHLFTSK